MFRNAYQVTRQFTSPVVISRKTIGGKCSASIGAFVGVNREGWIITAAHIVQQALALTQADAAQRVREAQVEAINQNASLNRDARRRQLSALPKANRDDTHRASVWWGRDGVMLVAAHFIADIDIAIGKLEPFDQAWFPNYPIFKDPSKQCEPGVSLCRLGFPFHSFIPIWDAAIGQFRLPPGALPFPLFPIDGIFTRVIEVLNPNAPPLPFPLRWLETSSPGLAGQSGGPIFDDQGTIWAIQSRTMHYPLGFDPPVPNRPGQTSYQFLNVGVGVHVETAIGLMRTQNVAFQMSTY
jgi:hypothetical protein